MSTSKRVLAVLLALLLGGCTRVQVKPVVDKSTQEGVRFYRPHPYLWVSTDSTKNLKHSIIWLPNTKEEYVISMKSGFGSSQMTFALNQGWMLTNFNENRDSKTLETLQALPGFMSSMTTLMGRDNKGRDSEPLPLKPGLYAFVFDLQTGIITGLKPINIKGN